MPSQSNVTVLITSFLEPQHIERLRSVDPRVEIVYEPELVRPPRYVSDHTGGDFERTPEQERRWRELLGTAEILFDFDQTHRDDLPELAPQVRWVQATSAGIGQFVKRQRYDQRMPNTIFTTASGVHRIPLSEFCIMAMLMFNKGLLRMIDDQRRKRWERYAGTDLENKTLGIIAVGNIGSELARLSNAFGMTVLGTKRSVEGVDPASLHLDQLYALDDLHAMLERCDYVVSVAPHTPETEKMLGAAEFARMPRGAIFINIGRGQTVDEDALIAALQSGQLGGAALDVFETEPLPENSPLWELPNVLVSPHSGSTTDRENERLIDLFADNLRRYLNGEKLINVLNTETLY